jgi:flavorubredoxin
MKISIIYHSYSGITRGIAERIQAACGGDLIEVNPLKEYTRISAYTIGCLRARREEAEPVDPAIIDVATSELIVIGTPVWAWKATPVTNGAINALNNCEGKRAFVFATCGGQAGETIPIMKKALQQKGVMVIGEYVLIRNDSNDEQKVTDLVNAVKSAMMTP